MGIMRTIGAGKVLASELKIPAYAKRNGWKMAGMAAGAGVAGYSANDARKNGVGFANGAGMAAGIAGGVLSARGTGLKSMMTMAGREQAAATLGKASNRMAKTAMKAEDAFSHLGQDLQTGAVKRSRGHTNALRGYKNNYSHNTQAAAAAHTMSEGLRSVPGPRTAVGGTLDRVKSWAGNQHASMMDAVGRDNAA